MSQSFLTKLFPSRKEVVKKASAKPTATKPAPTRLGVDSLEDRTVPAITANLSPTGVLSIVGDAANDRVAVSTVPMGSVHMIQVDGSAPNGNRTFRFNASSVREIQFNGGAGNDYFSAFRLVSPNVRLTSINGGPGDDYLVGSIGNDVFHGSPGNDQYYGLLASDQLHRGGHRGFFSDNFGGNVTTGLVNGQLTYRELTAPGTKLFARPNPLNSRQIELYGPSGAGFVVQADSWTVTNRPDLGSTVYRANGTTVQLITGHGRNLSLPASLFRDFRIGYSIGGTSHWAGPVLSDLAFNTSSLLGPLTDEIESKTGMTVSLPGLSGGLDLGANLGFTDLPVASAVPYLYGYVGSTTGVSVGDMEMDAPLPTNGWGVSIAIDPTDIGGMALLKTPVVEIGFGWSQNGEIPYLPTSLPDDKGNPEIAGNLYLSASGQLGSLPVSLTGSTIIDLDANNDGTFVGLDRAAIGRIARGQAGLGTLTSILNDVKLGFNGQVDLSLPITKSLDLSLKVGEGSLYWTPGLAAFRASSTNPFAGTPLAMMGAGGQFDFQGWFSTNGDLRVAATSTPMDYHYDLAGVDLFQMKQTFTVEFAKTGSWVSFSGSYDASITIGDMRFLGAHGEVSANLAFSVNTSTGRITVSGSGRLAGEVCIVGIRGGLSVELAFDNHGVYVDMPGGDVLDFEVKW